MFRKQEPGAGPTPLSYRRLAGAAAPDRRSGRQRIVATRRGARRTLCRPGPSGRVRERVRFALETGCRERCDDDDDRDAVRSTRNPDGPGDHVGRLMRAHGLSSFPDPTAVAGGGVHFDVPPAMATSAAYGVAMHACVKLQPPPTAPSGAQLGQLVQKLRTFATCMRKHGVPSFPDPTGSGHFDLAGTGISKTSPRVVAAGKLCLPAAGIGP